MPCCCPLSSPGISIVRSSMRLYSPFYSSDIIIASPLGLRTVLGAEGESKRDFDFLSSIELLVVDQADVFLMQNWEHVLVRTHSCTTHCPVMVSVHRCCVYCWEGCGTICCLIATVDIVKSQHGKISFWVSTCTLLEPWQNIRIL